jgi:hypothetical protein
MSFIFNKERECSKQQNKCSMISDRLVQEYVHYQIMCTNLAMTELLCT